MISDDSIFSRTELLIGSEAVGKLKASRVAVFGIGGVGGHAAEALVRAGVGTLDIVDSDKVVPSNINRQIVATASTVGMYKTEVMAMRAKQIVPDITVNEYRCFFLPENSGEFPFGEYDYVLDCVDTVTAKIALVMACKEHSVPVISAMGAGNKINPAMFEVADIYDTSVCPLARVMRRELKNRGIAGLKCVYSKEKPIPVEADHPGSVSWTPSVAGLIMAGEVVKDLTGVKNDVRVV